MSDAGDFMREHGHPELGRELDLMKKYGHMTLPETLDRIADLETQLAEARERLQNSNTVSIGLDRTLVYLHGSNEDGEFLIVFEHPDGPQERGSHDKVYTKESGLQIPVESEVVRIALDPIRVEVIREALDSAAETLGMTTLKERAEKAEQRAAGRGGW